jgi:hypothetical protein
MTIGFSTTTARSAGIISDSQGNQYVAPVTEGTNWGIGQGETEKAVEDAYFFNENAYMALRKLTGQDFSNDKRAWLAWWYRHRHDFEE